MRVLYDQECTMRDGVILRQDLYMPDNEITHPVVLMRTPYGKGHFAQERIYANYKALVDEGYAIVIQDVRGTGASDGMLNSTAVSEFDDGFDTVNEIASRQYCNGKIGMYGLSYFGFTQLAAASLSPTALRCICPFENAALVPFSGSAQRTIGGYHMYWLYNQALSRLPHMGFPAPREEEVRLKLLRNQEQLPDLLKHLPLRDTPAANIPEIPLLKQYVKLVDGIEDDSFWAEIRRPTDFSKITTPMLHLTGWFDVALNGTIDNYSTACSHATPYCRMNQWLIIGPWSHGGTLESTLEGESFGPDADGLAFDIPGIMQKFFDAFLKDDPEPLMRIPRVQYFQLGEYTWHTADKWPPENSVEIQAFLTSNGELTDFSTKITGCRQSFHYDPSDPYPSEVTDDQKRHLLADRRQLLERTDALHFRMPVRSTRLCIAGRLHIYLFAESSAVDTDFVCSVSDTAPDGMVRQLACGLTRGRFRHGTIPEALIPGVCEAFDIDIGNIAHTVLPGHELLLTITSSNYPLHNVNLNDGLPAGQGTCPVIAQQTIWMDYDHPSRLYIPVLEE
jgi:uncharacterized protein